jgi:hypothetical protein
MLHPHNNSDHYYFYAITPLSPFSQPCYMLLKHYKKFGDRGSTVVKVLRYKSEGRWFDTRRCHSNFSLTHKSF